MQYIKGYISNIALDIMYLSIHCNRLITYVDHWSVMATTCINIIVPRPSLVDTWYAPETTKTYEPANDYLFHGNGNEFYSSVFT